MAMTRDGLEFHLLQVVPNASQMSYARSLMYRSVRETDAVFQHGPSIIAAVAADVRGATKAARRLLSLARSENSPAKVRLVYEPFPPQLAPAATRVISGQVGLEQRPIFVQAADSFYWTG